MVTEGRGPDTFWGCQGPGLLLAFCGVRAPACCHHRTVSGPRPAVTFLGVIQQIIQNLPSDVVFRSIEALFYEGAGHRYIGIRTSHDPMYPKKALFRKSYIIIFETKNPMYGQTVT